MRTKVYLLLTLLACSLLLSSSVGDDHQPIEGEPYKLHGKRLVFTNWHFVRTIYFLQADL